MLKKYIPFFGWIKHYKVADLKSDLLAGLIVAIMLIPQGMAYAMLAGLSPVTGLYAATIPAIVYALFGTSRQDRKSTRLNSSHVATSYAVFCLKKKKDNRNISSIQ